MIWTGLRREIWIEKLNLDMTKKWNMKWLSLLITTENEPDMAKKGNLKKETKSLLIPEPNDVDMAKRINKK